MAQLIKGTTYITGDVVTATNLNNLADLAVLDSGAITDQTAKTVPLGADSVLVYSAADNALRKSTLAQVGANMTLAARNIQVSGAVTGTASFDGSANINIVTTLVAQAVPAGSVFNFAASTAPTGYLECNGNAVSRTTYAALFAVTSTTFGVGDGSTTFNLPNLRGEFVRGWDNGRGVDASRAFGSAQGGLVESHNHTNGAFDQLLRITGAGTADGWNSSPVEPDLLISGTIQPYGGTETRPRNIALLYCIKT